MSKTKGYRPDRACFRIYLDDEIAERVTAAAKRVGLGVEDFIGQAANMMSQASTAPMIPVPDADPLVHEIPPGCRKCRPCEPSLCMCFCHPRRSAL